MIVKKGAKIVAFLVGLVLLLLATSYIFKPKDNIAAAGMDEVSKSKILGERENSIDVVVVGDSESYSAISPMQIWKDSGYTSYVCGTSGQTLDCSLRMVQQAFERQNPKIVILETNTIYRKMSASNALLTKLGNVFSVFDNHDRWKSLTWRDFYGQVEYTQTDDYKGYRYSVDVNASKTEDHMAYKDAMAVISEINAEYVKKIKKICDENGAKLLLLSTPSTKNWNYKKHNGVATLAEEMGCEYVDLNLLNEKLQIDWKHDTRDKGDHMNFFGATKVSKFVAEYLKETKLLQSHQGDETYESWDKSLEIYENIAMKEYL